MEQTATADTPVAAPPPESAAAPDAPPQAESVADHAAVFSPDAAQPQEGETAAEAEQRVRDERGRFARGERHRAKSQRASAADVPRIGELTKKWRSAESAHELTKKELADLKAEVERLKAPKVEPPAPPAEFTEPEPTFEQFNQADDPLNEHIKAQALYQAKKYAAEAAKAQHEQAQQQYEQQRVVQLSEQYRSRAAAYAATVPDFQQTIESADASELTPVLRRALLEDDRGPEFVYHLAKSPALFAEVQLLSDGRPITDAAVAQMRRLLNARVQVAQTGSTAPPPMKAATPPKPPNPVRTGPIRSADDPPGEGASIAEHARYYGPKPR